MNLGAIRAAAVVSISLSLMACGGADDADIASQKETLGTSTSAITASGYWSWGTPGMDGEPLDLGTDVNRTCFLQGITGELRGQTYDYQASVRVYRGLGHWWLATRAGIGSGVMGHAACIPTANNRRIFGWLGNTSFDGVPDNQETVTHPAAVTPFTQCFLTEVQAWGGFNSDNAYVELVRDPGSELWKFRGWLVPLANGGSGGRATAYCVDMLESVSTFIFQGPASASGGITPILGEQADTTCTITRLKGRFASDPGGWWDGVRIYPSGSGWRAFASSSKRFEGRCYKSINWF